MAIKIALAGNPNSGKTTLFNTLTGLNQYVGNWPGVTVEKKEGKMKGQNDVIITDLPGIYSLSPYTLEEVVARNYLINEKPDAILNIVDGSNIERNLYLTTQLLELGIPVVVAINMMDIVNKRGDKIDTEKLSENLGCPVCAISALKNAGIFEAVKIAVDIAKNKGENNGVHKFSDALEKYIGEIIDLTHEPDKRLSRFFAIKLFEKDEKIGDFIKDVPDVSDVCKRAETEFDDDSESIVTNERYQYISDVVSRCYIRKNNSNETISDKIDKILTNKILALPIFALVMFVMYYVSVTSVGTIATDWANDGLFGEGWSFFGIWIPGIPVLFENALVMMNTPDWLNSLILDGIVGGVGAVLGFVPQIFVLFIFLAFLEGCGYMSRIAFIMDRVFRKFGLSGKSFIPMLIGTGCSVPGIMGSRTIENEAERKMTIITTSFIPCSAKLPIIALISGALFGGAAWVAPSAYFVGIAAVVVSGIILRKTKMFSGDTAPFILELPAYHLPTIGNVLKSAWERGWSFIKKAGTVILLSTMVLWFLQSFGFENGSFAMVENINNSILATLGNGIAWIFTPLGWGNWKATVASITGLIAKENVVGTFGVLYGVEEITENGKEIWKAIAGNYTALQAYSFLVFNLLCAPCFAAIGAIKREMNSAKWTWFAVGYQTLFAYLVSLCIYQIGTLVISGSFGFWTALAIFVIVCVFVLLIRPNKREGKLKLETKVK